MSAQTAEEKNDEKSNMVNEFIPNPAELDGVPDLSQLVYLEMKHVLHNLQHRYCFMKSKHCYTSISTILVAVNPYERLPIYGEDVITEFDKAAEQGRLLSGRPHPYGVSARGYMRMVQRKTNQSIIVCGESGAGKTETTKLLMRYLAMTAPSTSMQTSIVEQQIIAASPILEAYGNAKTVMNNNSSRFGKFTKLLYDIPNNSKEGYILGSYLETYLLEKSRVVFQSSNERNYHIFYFLHSGIAANSQEYKDLHFSKCEDFWYTNQGKCCTMPSMNDSERYKELTESLNLMRIDNDLQPDLWRMTCGILNLGNIEFTREGDGFASVNMKKCGAYVKAVSDLWGISQEALVKRLTTANMKVLKNTIETKIKYNDAINNRDSIAKGIYEEIFLWLVQRINAELYQTDDDNVSDIRNIYFIGILDVFGFENFYINSLEQFCINFTNEKLQQYFNYHIIRSEQEEYIKESVFWKPLSIPDNLEYVNMIESPKTGFFTILDGACKAPKPDVTAFMQELFGKHKANSTLHQSNKPGSGNYRGNKNSSMYGRRSKNKFIGFMINHFADDVTYDASQFLEKNMEAVHPDTAKMMAKSNNTLVKQIVNDPSSKGGKKKKGKKGSGSKLTVSGKFFKGIKTLMKNLKATEPFFVRCVNPNKQKSKDIWDESVVEHQLRCGGLVEALKVLKLGYPTRVPYNTLYDRYHGNVTNPLIKNMGPEAFSTVLLIAFDVSEDDYELGLTKIFFKPSKAAVLDTIMAKADQPLTKEQNEKITKWVVSKRIKQMLGVTKAFLELRRRVRLVRAAQRWEECGRVSGIVGGTVLRHLGLARQSILARKREAGALSLQTLFRGNYERARYHKHIDKVKKATQMIWIAYRRHNERQLMSQWLDNKVEETRKRKKQIELENIEKQKAIEAENRRIEAEKQRLLKEEQEREKAQKLKEEQLKKEQLAKQDDLNAKKEEYMKRQEIASNKIKQDEILEEKEKARQLREVRNSSIKYNQEQTAKDEEAIKTKQENEVMETRFPETMDDDNDNDENENKNDNDDDEDDDNEKVNKHENKLVKKKKNKKTKTMKTGKKTSKKRYSSDESDKDNEMDEDKNDSDNDNESSDDSENEYDSNDDDDEVDSEQSEKRLQEDLKNFRKICKMGHLFLKYTGKRRRKPQDRIIKVAFDSRSQPLSISWGSGSRHIDFEEIQYIAYGHKTPVFISRKDMLDEDCCLSVVGKSQILDIQAHSKDIALLWVKGLRKLLKQSDEDAERLTQTMLKSGNLEKIGNSGYKHGNGNAGGKSDKDKKSALIMLQQDLFIMTTATVFRNLEQEGMWEIDDAIKDKFNAKVLYGEALKLDIPWRQWNHWIRKQIVSYLREYKTPKISMQQQYQYPQYYQNPQYRPVPAQPVSTMPTSQAIASGNVIGYNNNSAYATGYYYNYPSGNVDMSGNYGGYYNNGGYYDQNSNYNYNYNNNGVSYNYNGQTGALPTGTGTGTATGAMNSSYNSSNAQYNYNYNYSGQSAPNNSNYNANSNSQSKLHATLSQYQEPAYFDISQMPKPSDNVNNQNVGQFQSQRQSLSQAGQVPYIAAANGNNNNTAQGTGLNEQQNKECALM